MNRIHVHLGRSSFLFLCVASYILLNTSKMDCNTGRPIIGIAAIRSGREATSRRYTTYQFPARRDMNSVALSPSATVLRKHEARLVARQWVKPRAGEIVQSRINDNWIERCYREDTEIVVLTTSVKTIDWRETDGRMDMDWLSGIRCTQVDPRYLYGEHRHPIRFKQGAEACFRARAPKGFNARQVGRELGETLRECEVRVIGLFALRTLY